MDCNQTSGARCSDRDRTSGNGREEPTAWVRDEFRPSERARVFVAEDQLIVRQGLCLILESDARLEVVGEAESGRCAVEKLRVLALQGRSGVVLMDIAMPSMNGITATREVLRDCPGWRVLVLSGYCGPKELEESVTAGASGCIPKESNRGELIEAILTVHRGGSVFGPEMLSHLVKFFQRGQDSSGEPGTRCRLTGRETEVLQLVAEGYANKQIAAELRISIKTVEKHRQHLMDKLNLHETAGLTRYALEHGLVECSPRLTLP
jgi:DNA-binding NarL/FixJ family response regulator